MSKTTNIRIASGKIKAKSIQREHRDEHVRGRIRPDSKSRNAVKAETRAMRFDEAD